jgi:hypothetical protein
MSFHAGWIARVIDDWRKRRYPESSNLRVNRDPYEARNLLRSDRRDAS